MPQISDKNLVEIVVILIFSVIIFLVFLGTTEKPEIKPFMKDKIFPICKEEINKTMELVIATGNYSLCFSITNTCLEEQNLAVDTCLFKSASALHNKLICRYIVDKRLSELCFGLDRDLS